MLSFPRQLTRPSKPQPPKSGCLQLLRWPVYRQVLQNLRCRKNGVPPTPQRHAILRKT